MREVGHYLPKVFVDELKTTRAFSSPPKPWASWCPASRTSKGGKPGNRRLRLLLRAPSIDDRIINQYGLFSVTSRASATLEPWLAKRPGLWKKVIVSAAAKWEIRDKLDQLNSNERVFFPGLDGLSPGSTASYFKR